MGRNLTAEDANDDCNDNNGYLVCCANVDEAVARARSTRVVLALDGGGVVANGAWL